VQNFLSICFPRTAEKNNFQKKFKKIKNFKKNFAAKKLKIKNYFLKKNKI